MSLDTQAASLRFNYRDLVLLEDAVWTLTNIDQDDHKADDVKRVAGRLSRQIAHMEAREHDRTQG